MATLTTMPTGFGYFFGYLPSLYYYVVGNQSQYSSLNDFGKSSIIAGYTDQSSLISAVPSGTGKIAEILDRSTPVDLLIAAGWVVQYTYAGADSKSFDFGFGFNF